MAVKTIWDKTAGYKTASGGILLLLYQLFKLVYPDALQKEWDEWIYNAIGFITATGVIDKAWRYRKEIKEFIKRLFTKKQK